MYKYNAKIISVYDGDSVTAEIDLGFRINFTEKIRLSRIDAPEIRGLEREFGLITRDRLREMILDKEVIIHTIKDRKGKYGRYLGEIFIMVDEELININDWLVSENLAIYREY